MTSVLYVKECLSLHNFFFYSSNEDVMCVSVSCSILSDKNALFILLNFI